MEEKADPFSLSTILLKTTTADQFAEALAVVVDVCFVTSSFRQEYNWNLYWIFGSFTPNLDSVKHFTFILLPKTWNVQIS